jgi:prepilin-type N-terminal cleavage/methylation domain-containing protein
VKIRFANKYKAAKGGFGLTESLVAVVIMGMVFVALYAGMASGFQSVRAARENLRATQILLEKFETIRLYNWDQITTNGFLPATFTNRYAPGQSSKGVEYVGTVTISSNMPAGMTEPYIEDMRMVAIRLEWGLSGTPRTRTFTNFVARYGLQNYIVQ